MPFKKGQPSNRVVDYSQREFVNGIKALQRHENKNGRWKWLFKCYCGKEFVAVPKDVEPGKQVSCGCNKIAKTIQRNIDTAKHGQTYSPTWITWYNMRQRCRDKNDTSYKYYGAKGVKVCDRWNTSFENFLADMGERPHRLTIDRINPFGNYEPGNCRWATYKEQANNKRSHHV